MKKENHRLAGPQIKIKRAHQHLQNLQKFEKIFFDQSSPVIDIRYDDKVNRKLVKIRLEAAVPEIIHVISGELIYQLRSALDQLAVAFARMSVLKPNATNIYFPTGDNIRAFNASILKNLVDVDFDLVEKIRQTCAYDGGDEILRAVFRMANIDKHIEMIPAATSGQLSVLSHFTISGAHTGLIIGVPGSLYDGVVISELMPDGIFMPNNPDAKIHVDGQFMLGKASIYEGKPLISFLNDMTIKTSEVFDEFFLYCQKTSRTPSE